MERVLEFTKIIIAGIGLVVIFVVIIGLPIYCIITMINDIEKNRLDNEMRELEIKEIIKNRTNIYDDCKFYDSKYYCE